ncbi:uncharacterized protein LOC107465479 [Arachis duranensis]|uniref:Uncharacterized protein LOC107465479 n=1 Tax=Arachis duranensis TaxID=130453 RepID=A0A6P4BCC3_ARADU|nr:uncharacterized protein LOC107465479 [Arachis duranensis]
MMKNKSKYKGSSSKEHKIDLSKVTCHHCKEAGYFKLNYPKLKKEDKGKKERKRVLMAAWEDLENDSNEEEHFKGEDKDCFIAGHNNLDEVNYYDLTIDDLHAIIDDLTLNTSKLLDKYNKCRSEKDVLKVENEFLKEKLKETECYITKESAVFNDSSIKFVASSSNTKSPSNQSGIGYVPTLEKKIDEIHTSETEHSPRAEPTSNRPGCDAGNQTQKDNETAQNHENENSRQAEPETTAAKNSRDNPILSHGSEGDPETISTQNSLVTETASKSIRPHEWRFLKNYPEEFVIGDVSHGVKTRSSTRKANEGSDIVLLSQMEPQNVKEALSDPSWVKAMEDELLEFEKNQVWTLVPRPNGKKVTITKWIFRNKLREDGSIARIKARLMAQGYDQEERIDYDEFLAPLVIVMQIFPVIEWIGGVLQAYAIFLGNL